MRTAGKQPSPAADPGPDKQPRAVRAFASRSAVAVFVLVSVAGVAADLASKHVVFRNMLSRPETVERVELLRARAKAMGETPPPPEMLLRMLHVRQPVAAGVNFTLSTNPGVVFGLSMPRWMMAVSSIAAVGMVVIFFGMSDRRLHALHAAFAMILAGAAGNLYDRFFNSVNLPGGGGAIRGQVRDFIDLSDIHVLGLNYPWVFNVADVLLVIGVGILLIQTIIVEFRVRKRV